MKNILCRLDKIQVEACLNTIRDLAKQIKEGAEYDIENLIEIIVYEDKTYQVMFAKPDKKKE